MRLIDANALLEHIKDLPTWWADGGGVYGQAMKYPEGMFDVDDVVASIENAPTLTQPNEWVSVEEKLPEIERDFGGYGSVTVIAYNGRTVIPLNYEKATIRGKIVYRWKYMWDRIYEGEPITLWKPLPPPPTEGGENNN